MRICIIIPVHNENKEIGRIVSASREKNFDVVVIDDGSMDNSGFIAQEQGAVVIRNTVKTGKGLSLRRGFEYALGKDYDGVITLDGDGQHDVGDLDHFIEKIKSEPGSIVTGNRMKDSRRMPFIRFLTNRVMSSLISAICHQYIPDTQCGYRYIGRAVLEDLDLTSGDFEIETEVLIKASKKGYKIFSVPIKTIYRNEKSKINSFKDTIRFFAYLLKEMRCKR